MTKEQYLNRFYREIQEWIDLGCPDHGVFSTEFGLCISLDHWCRLNVVDNYASYCVAKLMERQFYESSLQTSYPFNSVVSSFVEETHNKLTYRNTARLQWIKDHQ